MPKLCGPQVLSTARLDARMPPAMTTTGSKFNLFRKDRPPPVPEKDVFLSPTPVHGPYASSSFSRSTASISASSGFRSMSPRSATLDPMHGAPPMPSSSQPPVARQNSAPTPARGGSMMSLRKALSRIPGKMPQLNKRPSNVSLSTNQSDLPQDRGDDHGDDNITLPWNINVRLR